MKAGDNIAAHIRETAQAIAELHVAHWAESTRAQRSLERASRYVSRPLFLFLVASAVAAWILANLVLAWTGRRPFDPPPFALLQGILTLLGVYVALVILAAQRRAAALDELRAQLTLEHTILTEHKAAKMIELLEELRRDDPAVANRTDQEARTLATPSDPKVVAAALVKSHAEMARDDEEAE
jgi:uncharacterized membrane protein